MTEIVHIVAVDSNPNAVLESLKNIGYPVHRAYIVHRNVSAELAESLRRTLQSLVETRTANFEGKGLYESLWAILEVIRMEKERGSTVLLNLTDADKILTLALLMAAQISGCKAYMLLGDKAIFIAMPPTKIFNEERIKILKVLLSEGGVVESINRLIELVDGKIEDQKKRLAQRARVSYYINELEENGLLKTERKGKNLKVELTELGKAYVIIFG
uniref:CRISPR locus-related DNA-binding protein n=1 Tax=Archaeoglobus fulgidus TaxID=2234 RepID=A0A7J2TI05_ARCFL